MKTVRTEWLKTLFAMAGCMVWGMGAVNAATNGVSIADLCDWEIVVATDAIPAEVYAAEEFERHVALATDRHLPTVHHPSGAPGQIFVGAGTAMQACAAGFDTGSFASDDLRIVVSNDVVVIAGGRPRGTLYGVYTFLEDYFGIRFLTADHTHVPHSNPDQIVPLTDRFYHPPLLFRRSYYGEAERDQFFAARLRNHTERMQSPQVGGEIPFRLINHSFGLLLPSSVHGREHPEYYGLVDGARRNRVRDDLDHNGNQLCLTHPDVLRLVSANVLAELRHNPTVCNISVSQNDNAFYCQCPACVAINQQYQAPAGSLLAFVNAVAERVETQYPQVWVGTLAYHESQQPPVGLRPRTNVQIQLCSSDGCILHPLNDPACRQNAEFRRNFAGWSKICDKVTIWNYNVNFENYLLPCPNLRVIEPNIHYLVSNGAKGVMMQGAYNALGAEFSELRNYVSSRLLWDPSQSGSQLIDEFLDLHYGHAAPPIRRYINLVHDHAAQAHLHRGYGGVGADYGIDAAMAEAGLYAFAEALGLADDAIIRARVEKASICAYRAALEPVWRNRLPMILDNDERRHMRQLAGQFFALCDAHDVTMASEVQSIPQARTRMNWVLQLDGAPE